MTYNITLTANHQSLTAEYLPLAAESVQYLTAKVVCETEDWTGREIKALFGQGCTVYEIPVTGGEITAKQQLNLTAGDWRVWLVGNSARDGEVIPRITTNVAHISVAPTGGTEGNPFPAIPPTAEEQLRADMGNLADLTTEDKSNLVAAINEVAEGGSKDAVKYTPQTLTDEQQAQARTNIGAEKAGTGYSKPASGIPKSDLADDVQTSLAKADTAIQSQTIPDWNQNDETAPDYVKNRPFYTGDPVETVLVEESTVSFSFYEDDGMYEGRLESTFSPTVGETYKVYWDGTAYECACVNLDGMLVIGNLSIMGAGSDTGEPFVMSIFIGQGIQIITADTSASHTFSISGFVQEVVKIDEKYLPELPHMDKVNPTGTGAFSLNRKADTTIGNYSFAEGNKTTASGMASHAEGYETTASGSCSHAEGNGPTASGDYSHAEGNITTASGDYSHAEGNKTTASGVASHAEGCGTKASSEYQHVHGKYNIEDTSNTYAEIVGNGEQLENSNAHTLDWSGNAWYAGDVYVRSTSGTDKDEGSKKLATEEYVDTAKTEAQQLGLTAATPGQIIKVKTVQDGKPTEWEAVDMPSGDKWEKIKEITIAEGAEESNALTINADENGNTFRLKKARLCAKFPAYTGTSTIPNFSFAMINGKASGRITPLLYTSVWPTISTNKITGTIYYVDVSGAQQIEHAQINGNGGWSDDTSRDYTMYGSASDSLRIMYGDTLWAKPITSIGGAGMLIYPGCHFVLYGVRE